MLINTKVISFWIIFFISLRISAQEYPIKPIRIVVAQAPASGPDMTARTIAQKLTQSWGQQVVVDNRAGANGIIGGDLVAKSKPDGYTLLMGVGSAIVINPFVYKKLPFSPLLDLAPITQVFTNTFGLVISPNLPVTSVKDLVMLANSKPNELSYGSAGLGNTTHLGAELFASASRIKLLHVPFKGTTPAQTDLISGQISMMFVATQGIAPFISNGKVHLLATCGWSRSAGFPNVPTLIESGFPGVAFTGWNGLFAPTGTSKDVVNKVSLEVGRLITVPLFREHMISTGSEPSPNTPEEFSKLIKNEALMWSKLIIKLGLEHTQ
jgi:tripartite-type tricarboxylate transporter receptor subunit TctC